MWQMQLPFVKVKSLSMHARYRKIHILFLIEIDLLAEFLLRPFFINQDNSSKKKIIIRNGTEDRLHVNTLPEQLSTYIN